MPSQSGTTPFAMLFDLLNGALPQGGVVVIWPALNMALIAQPPCAFFILRSGYAAGILRSVLTGSISTQDRYYRHKAKQDGHLVTSPICIYCYSGSRGDPDHLFWCCAAWDFVRNQEIARQDRSTWPLCLRYCGLTTVSSSPDASIRATIASQIACTRVF